MSTSNKAAHLPVAYVIQAQSKRDTPEVLHLLLGALFTNGYLKSRRACACNYKDGLVRDRLDDVLNFCASSTLIIDFTHTNLSFTPVPSLFTILLEEIKTDRDRVCTYY